MSDLIQYDTSTNVVGGMNIAEAIQENKRLVFNESYTVAGPVLSAPSVYACYDLTVLGDLQVDDIEVRGSLVVLGNIKTKRLSCLKTITCGGNIEAEVVFGNEIIAKDIFCKSVSCTGSIIARATLDIGDSLEAEKAVITGEGILGTGHFSAKYAATAEYFDFQGEVLGKVIELETDATFGTSNKNALPESMSFDEINAILKEKIALELVKAGEVDEDKLLDFIKQISAVDNDMLCDWRELTEKLVELSYQDKISNLRDYLYVIMAKKLLPEEIVAYETLEHVFGKMLTDAETHLEELSYSANNVMELSYSLKIVDLCQNQIRIEQDDIIDKIFQSIGIKYKTVKTFLGRE